MCIRDRSPTETVPGRRGTSTAGHRRSGDRDRLPFFPTQGPVVDVAVGGGQLHAGPGDLHGVAVDRGFEVGLGALGGQVDAAVADVDHALVGDGVLVLVDELAVVADPHRPLLRDIAVPVGGVAHQGVLLLAHHDVGAGTGDPVRVADVVAAAVGGVVGGDGVAVLLDDEVVGVGVGEDDLVAADGEVAGDVRCAVRAGRQLDPVQHRREVDLGAGRPILLGAVVQAPAAVVVLDPGPRPFHGRGGGQRDMFGDGRWGLDYRTKEYW